MNGNFVIVDVETTGLPKRGTNDLTQQPFIIEFAAVLLNPKGEKLAEYETLINPGIPIEAIITKITGLDDFKLVGKPSFAEVADGIEKIVGQADKLVAHNSTFDRTLLTFDLKRCGRFDTFPWPKEEIDTVAEFRHVFGRMAKLTELYEHFMHRKLEQKHRAMDDVLALIDVCKAGGMFA